MKHMKEVTGTVEGTPIELLVDDSLTDRQIRREMDRVFKLHKIETQKSGPGPFNVVPGSTRKSVREFVERRSFPTRMAIEGGPVVAAEVAGFGVGGLPGAVAGASSMELILQELGISPGEIESAVGAGLFTLAGPGTGKLMQMGGRKLLPKIPGVGVAAEKFLTTSGVKKVRSMVDQIRIGKQSVSTLYKKADEIGGAFDAQEFGLSQQEIDALLQEITDVGEGFSFGKITTILGNFKRLLRGEGVERGATFAEGAGLPQIFEPELAKTVPITFRKLMARLQALNYEIGVLETASGKKFGALRHLKATVMGDMERMIDKEVLGSEALLAAKQAMVAARKEFATQTLGEAVEDGIHTVIGEKGKLQLNPTSIIDKIRSLITKANSAYDDNFVKGLKNELPEILEFLEDANTIQNAHGLQAGSLVIASKLSRIGQAAVGGLVSFMGLPGLADTAAIKGVGALVGVNIPAMFSAYLSSPMGRSLLLKMLNQGRGTLNVRQLAMWGQILGQGANALQRETILQNIQARKKSFIIKPKRLPLPGVP